MFQNSCASYKWMVSVDLPKGLNWLVFLWNQSRETFVLDGNRASFRKAAFEETPRRWTNVQNSSHFYCNAPSSETFTLGFCSTCYSDENTIIYIMYMQGPGENSPCTYRKYNVSCSGCYSKINFGSDPSSTCHKSGTPPVIFCIYRTSPFPVHSGNYSVLRMGLQHLQRWAAPCLQWGRRTFC
jgi:hypothetical protein